MQVTCLVSDKTMLQSYLLTISLVLLPPHDSICLGNFRGAAIFVIVVPDSLVPGTLISIKGKEPFLGSQVHKSITEGKTERKLQQPTQLTMRKREMVFPVML